MTDEEWLEECARHAAEAAFDKGGAPLGWMADAQTKKEQAIAEFGQARFDEAYARWIKKLETTYDR